MYRILQRSILSICAVVVLFSMGLILYIIYQGLPSLGLDLLGNQWNPRQELFGLLYMLWGSVFVSSIAIAIAAPLGIGTAIAVNTVVPLRVGHMILSIIDIIAGIPSVIFGFIGLVVLVPWAQRILYLSSGESFIVASIVLAAMVLPYIVSQSAASIATYQQRYTLVAENLGISPWYTMIHLVLPSAMSSIGVGILLALSRALGETMAVMMVIGNAPIMPTFTGKGETIPALIALEMGSVEYGSPHYHSLYGGAILLIVLTMIINGIAWWRGGHHD